ncbi:MAG: hypothetical protein KDD69_09215 [Bdellovibrionales bacterium]|nr:hypothetical protein [Bdellovibrionales bacterium]
MKFATNGSSRGAGSGFVRLALSACSFVALIVQPVVADEADVLQVLSQRDTPAEMSQPEILESLAGGQDALVRILLDYRTKETPPFVGIRAQKLLLGYANREDVADALAGDVTSEEYFGLARIVSLHLDQVPSEATRSRLGRAIIERAKKEARFERYARGLLQSQDPAVSRMAREAFTE